MKFSNPAVEKIAKTNKNFTQKTMKPRTIASKDKLSNMFPKEIDFQYKKNTFHEGHDRPRSVAKK